VSDVAEINDLQEVVVQPLFLNRDGIEVPVDGVPVWTVEDPNIVVVTPSDDGLSAVISARGPAGETRVYVDADANLSFGVRTIRGILQVIVEESGAVTVSWTISEPRDRSI
jgi:hypothetical protein